MRNFVIWSLALLAVVGSASSKGPQSQAEEPAYQGKTLSEWTRRAKDKDKAFAERREAVSALEYMCPEGIPVLAGLYSVTKRPASRGCCLSAGLRVVERKWLCRH